MPQVVAAVVGVFNAVAGWYAGLSTLAAFAVQTAVVFGVSKIMANRAVGGLSQGEGGARVQLPPATNNTLPMVYGRAYVAPVITDAKISIDQKTMWYVCALSEYADSTAGSAFTFGDIYWNGNLVNLSGSNVNSFTNNAGQTDSKMAGKIQIYKFPRGSASGINTGGQTAIQILSDTTIQSNLRWNSTLYTSGGQSADMTDTCFVIVKVEYNVDADTTGLGSLTVELTNSITKPGDAILDYMLNTRYGAAIPLSRIDTASLTDLNTYSDQLITYTDVNGASATQPRYRVNGPLNVNNTCLQNIQQLADNCDSWLQYSDIEDKWKMVMNKPYDVAPNARLTADLYHVKSAYADTDANLVGGININPIDLNSTYNSLQVAYPNENINDQTDYQIFDFTDATTAWYNPALLSPNEPANKLDVDFPQVNNYIQSAYLGVRRLLQSREDLVINFQTDYSGIQVEAGDVIRITSADYGWDTVAGYPDGKLFRVAQVDEIKDEEGSLFAKIQAFEYNETIYADNALSDFVPALNTGLEDPNILNTPIAPTIAIIQEASLSAIRVTGTTPTGGIVQYIDFNYGTDPDSATHQLYRTVTQSSGNPYLDGSTVIIESNDLPIGDYYFSITARNDRVGVRSLSSTIVNWLGTSLTPPTEIGIPNMTSTGTLFETDAGNAFSGVFAGGNVFLGAGVGELAANTYITNIANATAFTVSAVPIVALNQTDVLVNMNGINGNTIIPDTLPGNRIIPGSANGNVIANGTLNGNSIIFDSLSGNSIIVDTLSGNTIIADTLYGNTIIADTLYGNAIITDTLSGNSIITDTLNGNSIITDTLNGNTIIAGTLNGNTITANTINGNTIIGNTIIGNAIIANTMDANRITALTITAQEIAANAITAGKIDANAVTAGTIAANSVIAGDIAAGAIIAGTIGANAVTAGTIAAGAVTAGTVAANVITTGELVIGAVTQARSTTAPVVFEQVPFYNFPSSPKTWPDNTRALYPAGGASIIPTTDPEGSANIEYTEGSRITIGVTTQLYAATNPEYNCIEVWKSGASTQFDRGFNVLTHGYYIDSASPPPSGYTQYIHAYGYGGEDLYSQDGGATWGTWPSTTSATDQTFTGGIASVSGAGATQFYYQEQYGPPQDNPLATAPDIVTQGRRTGTTTSARLILDENPNFNTGGNLYSYTNACFAPNTGGSGQYISPNPSYDSFQTATSGSIIFKHRYIPGATNNTRNRETTGSLQSLFGIFANDLDAGSQYTICACGGAGTIVRSIRDALTYNSASPPAWVSKPITLTTGVAVLSDLYDVAGDGSAQGSGTWVAVGQYGMIQVSTDDGDTWDQVLSPVATDLEGVKYGNGKWVVCGKAGTILVNSGDPTDSADWTQIQSTLTDQDLFRVDHSPYWDTFNIAGTAIILNSSDGTISFSSVFTAGPVETYELTRLTFFGSHPLVNDVSLPASQEQLTNGQVFSTTIVDTQYVQGQETTYFLVVGNMNGQQISVGQSFLLVQELKR